MWLSLRFERESSSGFLNRSLRKVQRCDRSSSAQCLLGHDRRRTFNVQLILILLRAFQNWSWSFGRHDLERTSLAAHRSWRFMKWMQISLQINHRKKSFLSQLVVLNFLFGLETVHEFNTIAVQCESRSGRLLCCSTTACPQIYKGRKFPNIEAWG